MTILNNEIKQLIKDKQHAYIATASKDGIPNVSVKGSIRIIDDDTIAFACIWSDKTIKNLETNPQIAIALADAKAAKGIQLKGKATLEKSGALFDQMKETLAKMQLPEPKCVARININEIYQWPPAKS